MIVNWYIINKEKSSLRTTISMDISDTELSIAHADLRHSVRALRALDEEAEVEHESFTTWRKCHRDEPATKKPRDSPNKSGTKNRARRNANRRKTFTNNSEVDTLRLELSAVHKSYLHILQEKDERYLHILQEKDEEIELRTGDYNEAVRRNIDLRIQVAGRKAIIDDIHNDLEITEGELTISQKSEKEWIGRTLKLKFIQDQIKKIGALPEDHASWVDPMVEQIDIPEVSIAIRDEFIPTAQTDNIDWTDEEEEEEEVPASIWTERRDILIAAGLTSLSAYAEMTEDEITAHAFFPLLGDIWGSWQRDTTQTDNIDLDDEVTDLQGVLLSCTGCGEFGHVVSDCTDATNHELARIRVETRRLDQAAKKIQKAWKIHQNRKKEQLDRELDDFMSRRV